MAGHDAIERRERLLLSQRQVGLNPALRRHRLDSDVLSPIHERQAEVNALGARGVQLAPDPPRVALRRGRGCGDDHAVYVQKDRPSSNHGGQRRHHPIGALALQDRAREGVLRIQGPRQQVVLLGHQPREHRLGDGDEREDIGHLEHRKGRRLRRLEERLRHALVGEAEAEPEAGQARLDQPRDVGALPRRGGPDPHAGHEEQLAALQPRRRVVQLAHVHPADRVVQPLLARDGLEGQSGGLQEVPDGERHAQHCTVRTSVP